MHKLTALFLSIVLVAADQGLKYWADVVLKQGDILLWPNVLHFTYCQNYGAAFSILQNKTYFLILLTSIVILAGLYLVLSGRIRRPYLIYTVMVAVSGGIGNLIDRIMRGYVVDYIYFVPINFPVFNFADCCVCIGMALICVYLLFFEESMR